MTREEIIANLCIHDERNPYRIALDEFEEKDTEGDCYCDNCFYNRAKLAAHILKLLGENL